MIDETRLDDGPSDEVLAGQLGMSGRTLHRKAAEAAPIYGHVLAENWYDLVQPYLNDPHCTMTEVAFMLRSQSICDIHNYATAAQPKEI